MSLEYLRQQVKAMRPGDEMQFARDLLMIPVPPPWSPADWILEGICGSAYEFSHRRNEITGNVIFRRRKKPLIGNDGLRTYVSADRRQYYQQRFDGLWERKENKP